MGVTLQFVRASGVLVIGASLGCSLIVNPDTTQLNPPDDVTADAVGYTDGVSNGDVPADAPMFQCATNCDDGIPCTVDHCNTATGLCVHTPNSTLCAAGQVCSPTMGCMVIPCTSDSDCAVHNVCVGAQHCTGGTCVASPPVVCNDTMFCNGMETCNPTTGCVAGTPPNCATGNPCILGTCSPTAPGMNGQTGACVQMPVISLACMPNTTCNTAAPINLSGGSVTVMGDNSVGTPGLQSRYCMGSGTEVWYAVTWPTGQDLTVATTLTNATDTVLVVYDACGGNELICNDDYSMQNRASRISIRGTAGATATDTVYVGVMSYSTGAAAGPFSLQASLSAVVPQTASCTSPAVSLNEGGAWLGRMPRRGWTSGSCEARQTPDDFYSYTGQTGQLNLTMYSPSFVPALYVREDCASGNDLFCDSEQLIQTTYAFAGGTADIFVSNGTNGATYVLEAIVP